MSHGSGDLVSKYGNITSDPQKVTKRRKRISKRKQTETKIVEVPATKQESPKGNNTVMPNSFPEETEETWVKSLWEEVCKANKNKENKGKAPITQIDLDNKQVHFDIGSRYGDKISLKSKWSKASTMKELPSFLGDGGSDKDIWRVHSQYRTSPVVLDTSNLQALLSTPVKVILPLAEVLRVKPELWHEVV